MSGERDRQLRDLEHRADAIERKISEAICEQLGYGVLQRLDADRRREVKAETDDAIDRWEEGRTAASISNRPMSGAHAIQRLLDEHYELEEKIRTLRHRDIGEQE